MTPEVSSHTAEPSAGRALSNEARLLLGTVRDAGNSARIRRLVQRVGSWQRAVDLSLSEGAQPVFARRVLDAAGDLLPPGVGDGLLAMQRAAEIRQSYLARRLTDVLELLSRHGIPVVLLKGAALAHTVYGSFAARPMSDVDLLVRPEDAPPAWSLLLASGWVRRFEAGADEFYRTMHHLPPLRDARAPSLKVGLELHTDIVPPVSNPFAFAAGDIWRSAVPAATLPPGVLVPASSHLLLHCSLHFAWSHQLHRAGWRTFRDVDVLLSAGHVPAEELAGMARNAGADACCYWTLRLAASLADVRVAPALLAALRPRFPGVMLRVLEQHFAHGLMDGEQVCPSERLQRAIWTLAFRPRRDESSRAWSRMDLPWHTLEEPGAESPAPVQERTWSSPMAWLRYLSSVRPGESSRLAASASPRSPS